MTIERVMIVTMELLNELYPLTAIAVGFGLGFAILKFVRKSFGHELEEERAEVRREWQPTVRMSPPPVPPRRQPRECGYCGQVAVGFGACPHCGAPRI